MEEVIETSVMLGLGEKPKLLHMWHGNPQIINCQVITNSKFAEFLMAYTLKLVRASGSRASGRVDLGGCPPRSPQIRACTSRAPGSSSHEFATRAIRRRYVDMVQVTMYLPGFASTAHETAPPSRDGFLGLVPPLQRYSEVLRLPAAHFAALVSFAGRYHRCVRCSSPPGPGRGAVDQSGVGRRYLQPPARWKRQGLPSSRRNPCDHSPYSSDPGVTKQAEWTMS